ncbi:MAG: SUMF1/EgtB/PvdO family nonheme iron enzyme [Planctomycetota bacterium]
MAYAGSLPPEDLSGEPLLQQALKGAGGWRRPELGGITLLAKLGEDSTGTRYLAVHPALACQVAVKVMPCVAAPAPRAGLLLDHATAALRVKSSRLVKLFEFAKEAGVDFFVTEYVPGKSAESYLNGLRARLKTGLDEAAALDICIAAAEGLAVAHAIDVLHLDIRPANLAIPAAPSGALLFAETKLDGLGQAYNGFAGRLLAETAAQTGTPGFMSPEQAQGPAGLTAASDVFSFGATLYALLAGQAPFDGPDLEAILSATVASRTGSLRTWRPDISRATARTVEICLQKNPVERFADALLLRDALLICRAAMDGTVNAQESALREVEALVQLAGELQEEALPPTIFRAPSPIPPPSTAAPVSPEQPSAGQAQAEAPPTLPPCAAASVLQEQPPAAQAQAEAPPTLPPGTAAPVSQERPPAGLAQAEAPPEAPLVPTIFQPSRRTLSAFVRPQVASAKPPPDKLAPATLPPGTTAPVSQEQPSAGLAQAEAPPEEPLVPTIFQPSPLTPRPSLLAPPEEPLVPTIFQPARPILPPSATAPASQEQPSANLAQANALPGARLVPTAFEPFEPSCPGLRTFLAAAAILMLAGIGVAAWQLGWLSNWRRPTTTPAALAARKAPQAEHESLEAEAQTKTAEQKKEEAGGAAAQPAGAQPTQPLPAGAGKQLALELAAGIGMEFVFVPAGAFTMGTERATLAGLARKAGADRTEYLDETPAHRVAMPPFYIAQSPVTVAQFRAFVAATGYKTAAEQSGVARTLRDGAWRLTPGACWKEPGFRQGDGHPVVLVSVPDCEAFAAWAARTTGKPLRLPTEAEWEYAARGPNGLLYPWGNAWDGRLANHSDAALKPFGEAGRQCSEVDDGFAFTSPVGQFGNRSWCGAVDMAGNVLQWCSDVYESYPESANAPELFLDAAAVPSDAPRVLRGGSYLSGPLECRTAARRSSAPQVSGCDIGMRLAFGTAEERR